MLVQKDAVNDEVIQFGIYRVKYGPLIEWRISRRVPVDLMRVNCDSHKFGANT